MSKKRQKKSKSKSKGSTQKRRSARKRGNAHDPHAHLLQQACACHQQGDLARAEQLYQQILASAPDHVDALHLYGVLCFQGKAHEQAISLIRRAIKLNPGEAAMHANLGTALHEAGGYGAAEQELRKALELEPRCPGALYNLGRTLAAQDKLALAMDCYQRALRKNPRDHEAINNLGNVLFRQRKLEEAIDHFKQAIQLNPGYAEAYSNLANALRVQGEYQVSLQNAYKATQLNPEFAQAWLNLANACADLDMKQEAIIGYSRALQIDPDMSNAMINLGTLYVDNYQYAQATRLLERLLILQPDNASSMGALVHYRKYLADWSDLEQLTDRIKHLVVDEGQSMTPFGFLGLDTTPAQQFTCIRNYVNNQLPEFTDKHHGQAPAATHRKADKLRVGFLSNDFRHHVVAYLILNLVQMFDRDRFDVIAYSYGQDDNSSERRSLEQAFDRFVDIRECSQDEAVTRIRDDRIDILIDLKGHTHNSRVMIPASRPAPIQVRWLGHAGTMGIEAYDYLIADSFVTPVSVQPYYTEKLVHLPDSYQVCVRKSIDKRMSRADYGLPGTGLILCCFNSVYKITPPVFDVWMRVLGKLPDAVLWLLVDDQTARNNLRKGAEARGIDPGRLRFAPFVKQQEHLLRYQVTDLFLDTLEISACATSADALWGGCPVVTCVGETFASRAAGSMLRAVGLDELITENLEAYAALILDLAQSPQRLAALRQRLQAIRATAPLFDCERFTRNFEAALEQMREIYAQGESPQSFAVEVSD